MGIFTSLITSVLEVPGDPGHTITIRKLAPKHLTAASQAVQRESMETLRAMGGPQFLADLRALGGDSAVAAAVAVDPLLTYDRVSLIQAGVVGWSYPDQDYRDRAVVEDMDDETQDWLARAILKLAKPSLFQTADDTEADRKNGSAPSTAA